MTKAAFLLRSTASKLISRASLRHVRSAPSARLIQANCRTAPIFAPSVGTSANRYFSSSADTLADVLARELAEETEEGRAEMPDELVQLKGEIEADWKIVDDGATTRLIRSIGASKVVVSFHCQDTVEGADEYLEEGEEEPALPFRFEIIVSKAGNSLVLNCISNAGTTMVDGAAMSTQDPETIQTHGGVGRNNYQGPEFPELAEDLQEAFHDYVTVELGVNEDVSAFVSMYADYKEQLEYVNFLKSVPKVLP